MLKRGYMPVPTTDPADEQPRGVATTTTMEFTTAVPSKQCHVLADGLYDDASPVYSTAGTDASHLAYADAAESAAPPGSPPPTHGDGAPAPFVCPQIPLVVLLLLMGSSLAQSLSASVLGLFMNLDMALGPVDVTRYWVYVGLTAWAQPLTGYLADALVVRGERRRPLFVVSVAANAVVYALYGATDLAVSSFAVFVVVSMLSQMCMQGMYVPLNGLLVEVGRSDAETSEESVARMSAIMAKSMVWRSTGSFGGTLLQLLLSLCVSVRAMLVATGLLFALLVPLMLAAPRALFQRPGEPAGPHMYARLREVYTKAAASFREDGIRSEGCVFAIVLCFVFFYTLMPDGSGAYGNFLYVHFAFPTWFYSLNGVIGNIGSIVGAYVFSAWMDQRARTEAEGGRRVSTFWIFVVGSVAWALCYVTNIAVCTGGVAALGIPIELFLPIDNFFIALFVRFAFMPTLTMAAEHAPKNFEATAFEIFSVASMGGGMLSAAITAGIASALRITREDYSRLWVLLTISLVCKLLPIVPAYLLPERSPHDDTRATDVVITMDVPAHPSAAEELPAADGRSGTVTNPPTRMP